MQGHARALLHPFLIGAYFVRRNVLMKLRAHGLEGRIRRGLTRKGKRRFARV